MINLREMNVNEADLVIKWNNSDEDFLIQWSNFTYPLTKEQITDRIKSGDFYVYIIENDNEPVGTIELFHFDKEENSARVGCYLLKPEERGKGYGTIALKVMIQIAFEHLKLDMLTLGVYDFNLGAIRCYEKCGLLKYREGHSPNGWGVYEMKIEKEWMPDAKRKGIVM